MGTLTIKGITTPSVKRRVKRQHQQVSIDLYVTLPHDASKLTPPPISKRHHIPNALNPDAYLDAPLDARCGYALKFNFLFIVCPF